MVGMYVSKLPRDIQVCLLVMYVMSTTNPTFDLVYSLSLDIPPIESWIDIVRSLVLVDGGFIDLPRTFDTYEVIWLGPYKLFDWDYMMCS